MPNNEMSSIKLNNETRELEDTYLREEINAGGLNKHTIVNSEGTEFPNRSKLQIKYANIVDDPNNRKTIINPVINTIVDKPTVTIGEYHYNGEAQGPTITGLTDEMIVQNATNIDAGTYNLIISLRDAPTAYWSDYTAGSLVYSYTIEKIPVDIPYIEDNFIYDTELHSPEIKQIDLTKIETSGDISATNAGDYVIYFNLKDPINYKWTDDTESVKSDSWSISRASTTITSDIESIDLNTTNLYQDFTLTISGSSSTPILQIEDEEDREYFTLENISGTTYRITAQSGVIETARLQIKVPIDNNYNENTIYIDIRCRTIPPLDQCSWEMISQISLSGKASTCWNIGDTKLIKLNGHIGDDSFTYNNYSARVIITDFDHNGEVEGYGINFELYKKNTAETNLNTFTMSSDDYMEHSIIDGTKVFNINHYGESTSYTPFYGGWAASDIRYDILGSTNLPPSNYGSQKIAGSTGQDPTSSCATEPVPNTVMALLPSDLRAVMRPIRKATVNDATKIDLSEYGACSYTRDYLPLMTEYELNGTTNCSHPSESHYTMQYQYYKNGNSIYKEGTSWQWRRYWTRSIAADQYQSITDHWIRWCMINWEDPNDGWTAGYCLGLAPVFLV